MASNLPDYVAMARPVPLANRAAWFLTTAPTYAGIMLWFVFWQDVPVGSSLDPRLGQFPEFAGGCLSQGLVVALLGIVVAALICHFLFYLVPGLMGMKTGLPLYIVGTSTYGVQGGFLMPGFLMGLLQFGWLGVNAFFAGLLLCQPFGYGPLTVPHAVVSTIWAFAAAFVGLKGIQYVARVATFVPLIPLVILVVLFLTTARGLLTFSVKTTVDAGAKPREIKESKFELQRATGTPLAGPTEDKETGVTTTIYGAQWVEVEKSVVKTPASPLNFLGVLFLISTYIVGFFATAGAAGADFGMNSRDQNDVQMGGIMGIAVATIVAGGLAVLIVAGAQGIAQSPSAQAIAKSGPWGAWGWAAGIAQSPSAQAIAKAAGEQAVDPAVLRALLPRSPSTIAFQGEQAVDPAVLRATDLMKVAVGGKAAGIFMYLLALAAFPPACFSSFIAANSFKTTLPKVNPFVSVGIGAAVAALLAISGVAGQVIDMFSLIGASFGPVCGAMAADYLLAGKKWPGPRAGFNLAGWISWAVGFVVGAARFIGLGAVIPCPPVAAFLVGFVLYAILAKAGMESQTLEMPKTEEA